jgi:hypothetical protein
MTKRRDDEGRLPPFVPLLIETLDSPAWRRLSHGARSVYVALRRRYSPNQHNNGRIFLSSRDARRELRSGLTEIGRWFAELEFYGFIVKTRQGSLGLDGKGKAPHWRLTELGTRLEPPTRDFLQWKGTKFGSPRKRSPAVKVIQKSGSPAQVSEKQNPDPENRIGVIQKSGSVPIQKSGSLSSGSDPENRIIQDAGGDPETRIVTRLTTPTDDLVRAEGGRQQPEPSRDPRMPKILAAVAEMIAAGDSDQEIFDQLDQTNAALGVAGRPLPSNARQMVASAIAAARDSQTAPIKPNAHGRAPAGHGGAS